MRSVETFRLGDLVVRGSRNDAVGKVSRAEGHYLEVGYLDGWVHTVDKRRGSCRLATEAEVKQYEEQSADRHSEILERQLLADAFGLPLSEIGMDHHRDWYFCLTHQQVKAVVEKIRATQGTEVG